MHENRWHVLHIIANHEKRVAQRLAVRSVEHYLPLYVERSRWTDRTVTLERPLFPGYVFARFPAEARISVISTPGVLRMIGRDQGNTVGEAELARIREGLAKGCITRPHSRAPVGSTVRVLRGVFEGSEGVVTEFRRRCQVVIALSCIGRCFSLEVDLADIEVLCTHDSRRAVTC